MAYRILIKKSAEKELNALPARTRDRISEQILSLELNPRPVGVKKLQGLEGYRVRTGNYRVLYTIDDDSRLVTIYAVGHRRDIYR